MRKNSSESFGLLIAYVIPGSIFLWGIGQFQPEIRSWLGISDAAGETIGGFLYGTVASVGCGLFASTLRWLLVDTFHHVTGVRKSAWSFKNFHQHTAAYELLNEIHYRYYQFYANTAVACLFAAVARWLTSGFRWIELTLVIALFALFLLASRDTLVKYYARLDMLLQLD